MLSQIDDFYLNQPEPNRSCLLAIRTFLLDYNASISEVMKYGMPGFEIYGKMLVYLWVDKKSGEPYILFVEGNHIEHPKLEKGDRSRMKIYRINPLNDLPIEELKPLLSEAIHLAKT